MFIGEPVTQGDCNKVSAADLPVPPGTEVVAFYHTHPACKDPEQDKGRTTVTTSEGDERLAERIYADRGVPLYFSDKYGYLRRYTPLKLCQDATYREHESLGRIQGMP